MSYKVFWQAASKESAGNFIRINLTIPKGINKRAPNSLDNKMKRTFFFNLYYI